jgi:hypothetical protein
MEDIGLIHFSHLSGINATNLFVKGNVGISIGATGIETCNKMFVILSP